MTPHLSTLSPRLRALVEAVAVAQPRDAIGARALLLGAELSVEDLAQVGVPEHPPSDSYGRCLLYESDRFELMLMSWRDGDMSAIHDHGQTEWGAVRVFGDAEHATFRMHGGTLGTCQRAVLPAGTVLPVQHELIHQMGNVGQAPFFTLHLYGSDDFRGGVTWGARVFELDEGEIQLTNGGVFFALPEAEVVGRQPDLKADFPTTLRHKLELLTRLARMSGSLGAGRWQTERERGLVGWLQDAATWAGAEAELAGETPEIDSRCQRYQRSLAQELAAAERICGRFSAAGLLRGGLPMADALGGAV